MGLRQLGMGGKGAMLGDVLSIQITRPHLLEA